MFPDLSEECAMEDLNFAQHLVKAGQEQWNTTYGNPQMYENPHYNEVHQKRMEGEMALVTECVARARIMRRRAAAKNKSEIAGIWQETENTLMKRLKFDLAVKEFLMT
jgi:hypothetical protein